MTSSCVRPVRTHPKCPSCSLSVCAAHPTSSRATSRRATVPHEKLRLRFFRGVISAPVGGPEHRFALVVAGSQQHAEQLAELSNFAEHQVDALGFFALVRTPNKVSAAIRGRLDQIEALVKKSLIDLGVAVTKS